jgi:hypothetical protein
VDVDDGGSCRRTFERLTNQYEYEFGDYLNCNYYRQFLCPERRPRTYEDSKSRYSNFRRMGGRSLQRVKGGDNLWSTGWPV